MKMKKLFEIHKRKFMTHWINYFLNGKGRKAIENHFIISRLF